MPARLWTSPWIALSLLACADPQSRQSGALALVQRTELEVAGEIRADADGAIRVERDSVRADVGRRARSEIELRFAYRGPSELVQPLASGELRRQIGVRLRAQDTCNVVYVMWHIDPTPGIHVSVKHNPGLHNHAACGDRGYTRISPQWSRVPRTIVAGEWHTLRARLRDRLLEVHADRQVIWRGALPADAFAFDGPVGFRTDNGRFDVELRVADP